MAKKRKVEHFKPIYITTKDHCKNKALHNKEFTLDFSRKSVARAEDFGLHVDDMDAKVANMTIKIFYFAFFMHHPEVTFEDAEDIFDNELHGLTEAEFDRLLALYTQGYATLSFNDETAEEEVKNARATVIL